MLSSSTVSLAAQALKELTLTNKIYISAFSQCDLFLNAVRDSLLDKAVVHDSGTFLPMRFESFVTFVDLSDLRKKVERRVGHSVTTWGRYGGITIDDVQNALLEEAKPIVKRICSQIYSQLEREFGYRATSN